MCLVLTSSPVGWERVKSEVWLPCMVTVYVYVYMYRLIRDLFRQARQQAATHPVIVFIDEVDSICRQRSMKEDDHSRRIKTELLRQVCCIRC